MPSSTTVSPAPAAWGSNVLVGGPRSSHFSKPTNPPAICSEKNVNALQVGRDCKIVSADLFRTLSDVRPPRREVDLIFLDPPYRFLTDRPKQVQKLAAVFAAVDLKPGGLVVFRHDTADALPLPALGPPEVRSYGSMTVEFLRAPAIGSANSPAVDEPTP